ncbi:DNA-protecting protein DprA [Enterobacteriaceae bacterium BIT-l23]|uniref:DNA-protecting protein DprA n=1 Tax=Jejubacter sp. L23 TaxID=3092086 RepID=UPI0015852E73|nr:DNA-protecting protein DprA [Enterobacteriaceae bacterium BIT-l23]
MDETEFWLRLMAVQNLSGEKMVAVATRFIASPRGDGWRHGLTPLQRVQFDGVTSVILERAHCWLAQPENHLVTALAPEYPVQLRAIDWFPGALMVTGNTALLRSEQLAIVGSRNHSWYGARWGEHFARALAAAGFSIVSGLALGIDAVAHRATLAVKGKTLAVLGNGLGTFYPRRHRHLAEQIIEQGGAIISEFPLDAPALPYHFPRRNRIISGLSRGVLVVEASLRSGSLTTARYALEQGRELFALPGAIGSPGSEGTHWLIKQGAVAVTEPQDIIDHLQNELCWLPSLTNAGNNPTDREVPPLPFAHLLANVGDEVTPVDVVAERAGQPVPVTVAQLLELELAGWIAAVPGGYVRLRRAGHVRRTNVFV